MPLAEFIVEDIGRLSRRQVIPAVEDWRRPTETGPVDPAPAFVEAPVYREQVGLWEHQKSFVKLAFDAHLGPYKQARFVLADQVGLGKTIQLAMVAQLIALVGSRPILILAPKTLIWQWQAEMKDLLDMPAAVWDGRRWVDEQGIEFPAVGPEGIRKCPRRIGIVSTGLIFRGSEASELLKAILYDCVIVDEAHRARRTNPPRSGRYSSGSSRPSRPTRNAIPSTPSSSTASSGAVGWIGAASSSASTSTRSIGWPRRWRESCPMSRSGSTPARVDPA
jgi:hypothetical protein